MLCPKCGKEVSDDSIFCPSCGDRLKEMPPTNFDKAIELSEDEIAKRNKKTITWLISFCRFIIIFAGIFAFRFVILDCSFIGCLDCRFRYDI